MRELCAAVCKAVGLRAYARGYAYLRLSAQIQLRFDASYVPPPAKQSACAHTLAARAMCRRLQASGLRAYARGYAYLRLSAQIRLRSCALAARQPSKTPYLCDIMVTTER